MSSLTVLFNNAWLLVGNFLALIVLTAALMAFALRSGRHALFSLIISLYAGYALFVVFPFQLAGKGSDALTQSLISMGLYAVLSFGVFLLMHRAHGGSHTTIHILPLTLIAALTAGFLLALGYHTFGIAHAFTLSKELATYFAPTGYFFYWALAPLAALFLFAR